MNQLYFTINQLAKMLCDFRINWIFLKDGALPERTRCISISWDWKYIPPSAKGLNASATQEFPHRNQVVRGRSEWRRWPPPPTSEF